MPSAIFSINSGISQYDSPDIVAFLTTHGLNLVVLDLNLNVDPPVDVPTILDICPALTTFTFNADWRVNPTGAVSNVTKRPHPHISTIGLHGLSYTYWGLGWNYDDDDDDEDSGECVSESDGEEPE